MRKSDTRLQGFLIKRVQILFSAKRGFKRKDFTLHFQPTLFNIEYFYPWFRIRKIREFLNFLLENKVVDVISI